jgi:23S rRNA pseudouridine2605 synthase
MRRKRPVEVAPVEPIRLQIYLARAGVASRRASEELIRDGRVTVNGRRAELGMKVDPRADTVRVDRRVVSPRATEWIALHKPRGYVTTRDDPEGRKTVYDLLPPELHHLFHVGRLDRDSAGLILLTNDGETANRLLHPRYGTTKEYRVDVEGRPDSSALRRLVDGVELEDGLARVVSVEYRGELDDDIHRLILVLEEGRNREVRRMLEAIGHPVRRLFRRRFGAVEVGRLKPGGWRHLTPAEIATLRGAGRPKRKP